MKFTDGYWKVREDLSLYQAAEAVETETTEHSITVYASGRQSGGRKDLGGVTLTIQFFRRWKIVSVSESVTIWGERKNSRGFMKIRTAER